MVSAGKSSVLEAPTQCRTQAAEGLPESVTRAPARFEYILKSLSLPDSGTEGGGGDLVTSAAAATVATSGHSRTHRLLLKPFSITAVDGGTQGHGDDMY